MNNETIYAYKNYRILEIYDEDYRLSNLKGDAFNPNVNPDIDKDALRELELRFEARVLAEGVHCYILEKWNPEVGCGWEFIDSCCGFVGKHADENHYIVDEFKNRIKSEG